jgi:hypothetical protein
MLHNPENRVALPLCIYALTAIWCWLVPSRVSIDTVESVINVFPAKALALATAALAIVHAALALRGRLVTSVAGLWALATTWMVTMFLAYRWLTPFTHSAVSLVHVLTVAGAAFALCILGWHLVRRRLAIDANWFARAPVVLGIAGLAFNYAALALRSAGVLEPPSGLSAMTDVIARLTVDLWIISAILVLGAVVHVVSSRASPRLR